MTRPGNGAGYTGMWERLGLDLKLHQELLDALGQLYPQIPSWWAPWARRCWPGSAPRPARRQS